MNVNSVNKRLLESPNSVSKESKFTKIDENTTLESKSGHGSHITQKPHNPSLSNTQYTNMNERDKMMLDGFDKMLTSKFESFARTEIDPIRNEVLLWKEENKLLKQQIKSCMERINFLENTIREGNLVFSNVPATNNHVRSIEELCSKQLKVETPVDVNKVVPIHENKEKKTVTLLVSFGSGITAERILMQSKHLRGTGIGLSKDYSKDVRLSRNRLLILRRKILDVNPDVKVKVYGNKIIIDKEKLTLIDNVLSNDKVDGKLFVANNFGINFDEIANATNNQ